MGRKSELIGEDVSYNCQAKKMPRITRGILQSFTTVLDDGQSQNNDADNQWNAGTFY